MKRDLPLVSIVTVNYNQPEYTYQVLNSLRKINYPNWEVIVVDNGCTPDGEIQLSPEDTNFQHVKSSQNLGFAGGNNLGLKKCRGKYCLLLNNDTEVSPDFLDHMVSLLENDETIGIVSPMLIYQENGKIQYAGATAINPVTGRGRKIGHLGLPEQYKKTYKTELAHGAALLFRHSLLRKVGYLHESYFLYYEEHDWTEHVKRAGYSVYYQGLSQVYHKESASVGKMSTLKTYYMNRSRILFILRNSRGLSRISSLALFYLVALPKKTARHLFKGEFDHIKSLFSASTILFSQLNEYNPTKSKQVSCQAR